MRRLVPDFILLKAASGEMAGKIQVASLFVDIAGFSAITDALLSYGQHGAEVLAGVMRDTFEPLVTTVYEQGGFVSSFNGDGFMALFPFQEGASGLTDQTAARDALTAAWRIRQWIAANGDNNTPYGHFAFTAKLGIASGEVSWGILRAENGSRATFYFKGAAIDGCVAAQKQARPSDIILDSQLYERIQSWVSAEEESDYHRLIFIHGQLNPARPPSLGPVDESLIDQFYPSEMVMGPSGGEFRQVVNLFVNLPTVRTEQQLTIFVRTVFALQDKYGGLLGRLDFGDKGSHLFLFWGAPRSFENDVERALNFILDLQTQTSIPIKAGMTYRIAHTGFIGSAMREEYTVYGWGVNLAARFMTDAPRDEIWVDSHIVQRSKDSFVFEQEAEVKFKGFSDRQTVYVLIERREEDEFLYQGRLVGRQEELQKLAEFAAPVFSGNYAGLLLIRGDPGIGKSRLAHEFQDSKVFESKDVLWAICQTDEILREPFNPFRYWLRRTFNVSSAQVEARNKRNFNRRLDMLIAETDDGELAAELDRTRSFLGAIVGLSWPDSLYEQIEGQQRYENTFSGLFSFLRAESTQRPVILFLEDIHLLDDDSKMFLVRLASSLAKEDNQATPIAILATTRPGGDEFLVDRLTYQQIDLHRLDHISLAELAGSQLGDPAERPLLDVLERQSDGNPFFAEQILRELKEQELLRQTAAGSWDVVDPKTLALPNDVRALLVARLDRLANEVREVVQTAAVLGREFELRLLSLMLQGDPNLTEKVTQAEQAGIWSALNESRYIFRHALLRDAAYNMQLRTRRQSLHARALESLETLYADGMDPAGPGEPQTPGIATSYGELAYHAEQAGLAEKAYQALQKAGDAARDAFQNNQAEAYYTRAMAAAGQMGLAPSWDLLRRRGQAYDVLGDFDRALADYESALAIAQELSEGRAAWQLLLDLGLLWASRDYERTGAYCREALELARSLEDEAAMAYSLNRLGNWHLNNGQLKKAKLLHQEALTLFHSLEDQLGIAATLDLLGQTTILLGESDSAVAYYEAGITLSRELGYHQLLISSLSNLSLIRLDMALNEEAVHLARQIGWLSGEIYARISQGTVLIQLGQFKEALASQEKGLALAKEIGHQQWQGWAQLFMAWLYLEMLAPDESRAKLDKVIAIAQDINSRYLLTSAAAGLIQEAILRENFDEVESLLVKYPGIEQYNYIGPMEVIRLELALARGNHPRATQIAMEMIDQPEIQHQAGDYFSFGRVRLFRLCGEALLYSGRPAEAARIFARAKETVERQGLVLEKWRVLRCFGLLYQATSRPGEAAEVFKKARKALADLANSIPDETMADQFKLKANALIDKAIG